MRFRGELRLQDDFYLDKEMKAQTEKYIHNEMKMKLIDEIDKKDKITIERRNWGAFENILTYKIDAYNSETIDKIKHIVHHSNICDIDKVEIYKLLDE